MKTFLATLFLLASVVHADVLSSIPQVVDSRGMVIELVIRPDIQDLAQAFIEPQAMSGRPVIYFNPKFAAMISREALTFAIFHEIAHHQLGHLVGAMLGTKPYSIENEFEADRRAALTLIAAGFTRREFAIAFEFFAKLPATDKEHPAGIVRVRALQEIVFGHDFSKADCCSLLQNRN